MTVRMKDIARDLSVSVVTISKVLRNHPDVGDETRERVLARVDEPSSLAWSFQTSFTLFLRKLPNPFPMSSERAATA